MTMKKELREKLIKANWTCTDCGIKYGEARGLCATYHNGTCEVCGEEKAVTETRDYNWFNKTLGTSKRDIFDI